ncbi:MAG TPA: OmpA family protein [Bacteroidales bacterium]|nr:OmpA family protein [Bacteroidales bacterium]HPS62979.1 OmpA family protein [Bacteroidales bacterium]
MTRIVQACSDTRFQLIILAMMIPVMVSGLPLPPAVFVPVAGDSCKVTLDRKLEKIYAEGIDFFRKGNYTMAGQRMRTVLKEEPSCVDASYVLGLVNYKKADNNLVEAEKNFRRVAEQCPGYDLYVYFYLGEIAYSKDDFSTAIKNLEVFTREPEKIKKEEDYARAVSLLDYSRFYLNMVEHPVPFDPHVVEGISTPGNEYLPILSPDNQMALYTREVKIDPGRNSLTREIRMKEKFYYSSRQDDGRFNEGEEMPDPFNINDNEGGATLTADNNTLYYTVCKYDPGRQYLNCDIYMSENIGGEWSPIRPVGGGIDHPDTWESQPSISADGRVLYFISDRSGGQGGYDIYRTEKNAAGQWQTPVNLGPVINSKGNEKSPFIHPDGKTLYFSSDGWMGLGGYDIFYSRLGNDGTWSKPVNIGYPINSTDDEVGFFVSTDGQQGFFASNKYNGKGGWDLYSFDLYDEARPEKVLFIKGNVKSELSAEPLKARIELKNIETKKVSEIPMDTLTGNYVAVAPFNSDYIMTVKKADHVYEAKYISKIDSVFKTPATVDIAMKPIEVNQSYRINDIYFGFNSFELSATSRTILDQLIEFLDENRNISIQIQGHTDNIGNDADNLKLSEDRAHSVYDYLVEQGIAARRLTYKGFGKSMPVADNQTEEGRAKNRRTVFVITGK